MPTIYEMTIIIFVLLAWYFGLSRKNDISTDLRGVLDFRDRS